MLFCREGRGDYQGNTLSTYSGGEWSFKKIRVLQSRSLRGSVRHAVSDFFVKPSPSLVSQSRNLKSQKVSGSQRKTLASLCDLFAKSRVTWVAHINLDYLILLTMFCRFRLVCILISWDRQSCNWRILISPPVIVWTSIKVHQSIIYTCHQLTPPWSIICLWNNFHFLKNEINI